MQGEDAKRMKELEAENIRLKRLLVEAQLDTEALNVGFEVKREPGNASARRFVACSNSGR